MKSLSTNYFNKVVDGDNAKTLAFCWRVELNDGRILGFTTHTRNVTFTNDPDNVLYKSAGFTPTASAKTGESNVDNIDVEVIIDSDLIKEDDADNGLWNNAKIKTFRFDYTLKPYNYNDVEKIVSGVIGEVQKEKGLYKVEFRSEKQYLQNNVIDVYKYACNANLCDSKCKLNITDYTLSDIIASVIDNRTFILTNSNKPDGYFTNGLIKFKSGLNNGLAMEVKSWTLNTKELVIQLPFNYIVNSGDQVDLVAGCSKSVDDCYTKFNNVVNFRGFPHIPGVDFLSTGKQ